MSRSTAELAALLIADGTRAASIAWSYLVGEAREWLAPRPGRSLSTVAAALLAAACLLGFSAALVADTTPAKAAGTPQSPSGPIPPKIKPTSPSAGSGSPRQFTPCRPSCSGRLPALFPPQATRSRASREPRMPAPADLRPASTDPASAEPAGTGPQRKRRWRGLTETVIALLGGAADRPAASVRMRDLLHPVGVDGPDARCVRPDPGAEGVLQLARRPRGRHRGVYPPAPGPARWSTGRDLVKRVIAQPGQTIYSSGNSIYINRHLLAEPYLPAYDPLGPPIASSQHPYHVPPGEFYVLGDNRADSCDSRY